MAAQSAANPTIGGICNFVSRLLLCAKCGRLVGVPCKSRNPQLATYTNRHRLAPLTTALRLRMNDRGCQNTLPQKVNSVRCIRVRFYQQKNSKTPLPLSKLRLHQFIWFSQFDPIFNQQIGKAVIASSHFEDAGIESIFRRPEVANASSILVWLLLWSRHIPN